MPPSRSKTKAHVKTGPSKNALSVSKGIPKKSLAPHKPVPALETPPLLKLGSNALHHRMNLAPRPGNVDKALKLLDERLESFKNPDHPFKKLTDKDFENPKFFSDTILENDCDSEEVDGVCGLLLDVVAAHLYAACIRVDMQTIRDVDGLERGLRFILLAANYEGTDEQCCLLAMGIMMTHSDSRWNHFGIDDSDCDDSDEEEDTKVSKPESSEMKDAEEDTKVSKPESSEMKDAEEDTKVSKPKSSEMKDADSDSDESDSDSD
jgi:hypothetical protein